MNNPDIFDILIDEHRKAKRMLNEVISRNEKGPAFENLRHDLRVHMRGEENYFYPVARAKGLNDLAMEAIEEHHAAKCVLSELEQMSGQEENWLAKVKVLREMLERHIEEEENRLITFTRKKVDYSELERMTDQYQQFETAVRV